MRQTVMIVTALMIALLAVSGFIVAGSVEQMRQITEKNTLMDEMALQVKQQTERADELEAMGLTVPSVARVFAALRQRGVPVPADVYTVKKACAVLCDLFEERGVPTC